MLIRFTGFGLGTAVLGCQVVGSHVYKLHKCSKISFFNKLRMFETAMVVEGKPVLVEFATNLAPAL